MSESRCDPCVGASGSGRTWQARNHPRRGSKGSEPRVARACRGHSYAFPRPLTVRPLLHVQLTPALNTVNGSRLRALAGVKSFGHQPQRPSDLAYMECGGSTSLSLPLGADL
jgi:hypothetical protein